MPEQTSDSNDELRMNRLAAALVEEAHVSIWAADINFRIVLWNSGAEQIYGVQRSEALGKNYLELFVDEYEREQSRLDCLQIIRNGYRQNNCLAYDHSDAHAQKYMLTNCFRITDPQTGEAYQAEIGVEISDLGLKDKEHRTLREVGIERRAAERPSIEQRRQVILNGLEGLRAEVIKLYTVSKTELDSWRTLARTAEARDAIIPVTDAKMAALEAAYGDDLKALDLLGVEARTCSTLEGFDALRERCDKAPTFLKLFRGMR